MLRCASTSKCTNFHSFQLASLTHILCTALHFAASNSVGKTRNKSELNETHKLKKRTHQLIFSKMV